jgi:hypothetical protein
MGQGGGHKEGLGNVQSFEFANEDQLGLLRFSSARSRTHLTELKVQLQMQTFLQNQELMWFPGQLESLGLLG